jgi:hypothetical protein
MINKHCVEHYVIVKSTIDKNMIDKAIKLFGLDCNTRFESPLDHIEEGSMERTMASWNLIYVTPEGRLSYRDSINSFMTQRSFEELDTKTNLQTISSPFGELDKQTKKDLLCAWVDGADIEMVDVCYGWANVWCPSWKEGGVYRVKPTISAKDTTKSKLISEAQQQLRDAQEALDKAQQL